MSLRSSGVIGFTRVWPVGLWVHRGVVGFTRVRSVVFIRSHCVLSSLGSSSVVGFIPVRPGGRWVHPGSTRVRLGGRTVHPVSLGSHGCALWIVGYIQSRRDHPCALLWS